MATERKLSVKSKRTVFVIDDHPIVREGLTQLINREPDLIVCGTAEDIYEALKAMQTLKPDIAIADISLKGADGIELIKNLKIRMPGLPVLVLSIHDESIYAPRALRAGARGFIMKQEATENVLLALRRVLSGEIYLSKRMANKMLQQFVGAREYGAELSHRSAERPRTGSLSTDRPGSWNSANRRRVALKRKDGGVLPRTHQRKNDA